MTYNFKDLSINKLSVIGAGQIGPDIALHFAKVFSKHRVKIVIVDVVEEALNSAKGKIEKKISKGVKVGAFKPEMADVMTGCITYSLNYKDIEGSDIVVEAATENEDIKDKIFKQVEPICGDNCLFFSNSSHMEPEVIYRNIQNKSRCVVTHYFFPAELNPIVEIVPSEATSKEVVNTILGFYESIGKVPIKVKSSYGYAVDPIFEGLCQLAIMCLEKGYGTVKEIDKVAQEVLGLGIGPFTALNLTGGNPITEHGLDEMNTKLMPWFKTPASLTEAVKNNQPWPTAKRDEEVIISSAKREKLAGQFLGAYFGLCSYILDLGICHIDDLNMACEVALVVKAPFTLMNKTGIKKSLEIVEEFCSEHEGFEVPQSLRRAAEEGQWNISNVVKTVVDDIAVLTIRRPKVLNALNTTVLSDLQKCFVEVENDSSLKGSVLTGFGVKAFVSGADINEIAKCKTAQDGNEFSSKFHGVLNLIETMNKPVVCAYNGLAFGGGNELAMACTIRICNKMRIVACQPEVNLGIIPGAGGTQRLPRLVGLEKGAEMLRTGSMISSAEAVELGLIYKEVEGDLIGEAISLVRDIATGKITPEPICKSVFEVQKEIPEVNIGHLSKKIDEIIVKAIYEGAALSLAEGLELEAKLFGECFNTEDMKIGIENFKTKGPRSKAEFVHK